MGSKTWRECLVCDTLHRFVFHMPSSIHCDTCGATVAETNRPVESPMAAFDSHRSIVTNVETGEEIARVVWDDERIRVVDDE